MGNEELVKVNILGKGTINVPKCARLYEVIYEKYIKDSEPKIVALKTENLVHGLKYRITKDCDIELLDVSHTDGIRIYKRSMIFIFLKAIGDLYPNSNTRIMHSINKGVYAEVDFDNASQNIQSIDVDKITQRMKEIISQKIKFENVKLPKEEAIQIFMKLNELDKVKLIESQEEDIVKLQKLDWLYELEYEHLVPDTGYTGIFEVVSYGKGLILRFPSKENPLGIPPHVLQEKMGSVFEEHKKWQDILGVSTVSDLNSLIEKSDIDDFIRVTEALQEKKIAQIADMIKAKKKEVSIVLIAGPSSSGKTTFAQRLSIQLRVNGLRPIPISLDNYYLDRDKCPRDENGDFDFEALEALDLDLFNNNLQSLLNGEETELPVFNFQKGCREFTGKKLHMENDQVLVIEGIHGLNEKLTRSIKRNRKFKIYVSALAQLNVDEHTRIPTTDLRLIRRIVRDYKYRASKAEETIKMWPSVRRGEEKNIFPFQEQADVIFNSALTYELSILKNLAEILLEEIDISKEEYSEAQRLLQILSVFCEAETKGIPSNSIIREFIGGSCFYES